VRQVEPLQRARPLHRDQAVVVGHVADVRAGHLPLLQPGEVRLAVRGVHDQEKPEGIELVHDQVVDDAAGVVRQQRVLRRARLDPL
jgi:hypothetical protein